MSEEKKQKKEQEKVKTSSRSQNEIDSKKEVQVPVKFQDIVQKIEQMTVLDLTELIKILEKKFNVSSQMPITVSPAANAQDSSSNIQTTEEKTSFNIELTNMGSKKIDVIKAVRTVTELGLKDAKDLVEAAPKMVKENVPKEEAENIKKQLEAAGATITLK